MEQVNLVSPNGLANRSHSLAIHTATAGNHLGLETQPGGLVRDLNIWLVGVVKDGYSNAAPHRLQVLSESQQHVFGAIVASAADELKNSHTAFLGSLL
jgi:hypothetical protein